MTRFCIIGRLNMFLQTVFKCKPYLDVWNPEQGIRCLHKPFYYEVLSSYRLKVLLNSGLLVVLAFAFQNIKTITVITD